MSLNSISGKKSDDNKTKGWKKRKRRETDLLVKGKTVAGHSSQGMMGISEGVLASFIRDTTTPGACGCFVLFIFMDLGQRVSTLTPGMGG